MRWIGEGSELYSVRVDLIAPDDSGRWVSLLADALKEVLLFSNGTDRSLIGVDQGRGHEGDPVLGLTFMVRAGDIGEGARVAVDAATTAAERVGVTGRVYDVVLVPEDTFLLPEEERDIPMPD
ncbi:MAG: hypothetical protein ACOYXM_06125 [Actinomycetota bacterium]